MDTKMIKLHWFMLGFKWIIFGVLFLITYVASSNVNEPPIFEVHGYPVGRTFYEKTPIGSELFRLKGFDPEGSPVKYGIELTDKFNVDKRTGIVTLVKPLDREETDTIRFRVTLEDSVPHGQQPNIVGVDAYVIVLDENDNAPHFLGTPYEAVVSEDTHPGTTILPTIRLTDPDLHGNNIEVTCISQLQFSNACAKFGIVNIEINQHTYIGALVLQELLDYKERPFYQLLLQASDGTNINTTGVEIKVADIQNSPPEFLDTLTGVVMEDDPIGTLVMTVKARDGDRGMPRKIIYELVTNPFDYFLLEPESGELRTAKPLDREALENSTGILTFIIKAREIVDGDMGYDQSMVSLTEATVTIKDVNDVPPIFNCKDYSVFIPENIPDGTLLPHLNMIVRDYDVGLNSEFSLKLEDITGAFDVEPKQATESTSVNIRVINGTLDYENPNQRKFIILVIAEEVHRNVHLSSTATVTVGITDVNDNAPTFSNPSYTALISEISETDNPIITITAKDRDSGHFGVSGILYQLIGKGSEYFMVDKKTGNIYILPCSTPGQTPCLDYEEQNEYFLNYKATDNYGKGQGTSVSLRLSLIDANDNPPKFQPKKYRAIIDEGAEKFEPQLFVQAHDRDKTSKIIYSLIEGNDMNIFKIDSDTGEIMIAKRGPVHFANFSGDCILLTAQADDGIFSDQAIISIIVHDVNNNAPVFNHELYTTSISELSYIGTIVEELFATDADSDINAEFVYRIQKGAFNDFRINETTGVVFVSRKLDYDQRNVYHLEVIAFDKGTPSLTGTSTLMINIENHNDKPPYFSPRTQRAEVTENTAVGIVFAVLKAIDPDSTDLQALNYVFSEPITAINKNGQRVNANITHYKNFFAIDEKTGHVSVKNNLDRDIAATISITLFVTDTSAPTLQQGKGTLIVSVIEVNHFAPKFAFPWTPENPKYFIEMQEEQPSGSIVGAFIANDLDNNIAGYAIQPPSPYFHISNITRIVRTSRIIDYEKTKQLNFTVVAYDTGVPQLSCSADVTVVIINVNDMNPNFENEFYNATIKENSPPGSRVAIVKAVDNDEGLFGTVSYSLIGERAADFNIDRETGEITVGEATVLDREVIQEIIISVMASDNAPINFRRMTSVPVAIRLEDDNDNRPVFVKHYYSGSVAENVSINPPTPILQVLAVDYDEGLNGKVVYMITHGNEKGLFTLNPESGILYPAVSLLGEAQAYNIKVSARDQAGKGPHIDTCKIYIHVIRVNQHKPEFIMPQLSNTTVKILENDDLNYLVMTVKAIDRDSGDNGKVSYHMKVGNRNVQETEEFLIDQETGELRAKIMLDRETKNKFELVIVAADKGSPTSYETLRLLTIYLMDTNDNVPEFYEEYIFNMLENQPKDYYIGKVTAEDKDEGRHAKIYYYITLGNENQAFYIDKSDGSLYTNCSFDREKHSSYSLTILAINDPDFYIDSKKKVVSFLNQNHGLVNVTIKILDENDNPPIFIKNTYFAGVNSMANVNELVTMVKAVDFDLGDNGTLQYYVASANLYKYGSQKSSGSIVPSPFNVTQDGKLVTSDYMVEYNQDRFIVDIVAKEIASPERFAISKVHIWVFEPCQLIRVILSRSPEEVNRQKNEIILELSNVTQNHVVIDDIRYHVDSTGHIKREWCDMYLHVVESKTQNILPIPQVLKIIDSKYDFLKDYYTGFAIENVVPAYVVVQEESFDIALAALIALLVILFIGVVTVTVICCYLKHWIINVPNDIRKKDYLIKKQIIDELNTTENPLWIEQKLKLYEEQELTMQVFSEPEVGFRTNRRDSNMSLAIGDISQDNTYATIQHPLPSNRHCSSTPDYTTLPRNCNLYESAMGFQGSTFQPVTIDSTQMTVDQDGQPQFVSGLA